MLWADRDRNSLFETWRKGGWKARAPRPDLLDRPIHRRISPVRFRSAPRGAGTAIIRRCGSGDAAATRLDSGIHPPPVSGSSWWGWARCNWLPWSPRRGQCPDNRHWSCGWKALWVRMRCAEGIVAVASAPHHGADELEKQIRFNSNSLIKWVAPIPIRQDASVRI